MVRSTRPSINSFAERLGFRSVYAWQIGGELFTSENACGNTLDAMQDAEGEKTDYMVCYLQGHS